MRIKLFFKYLFNYDKFIKLINKIIQPNPMIDLIISRDLMFASLLGIGHSFVVSLFNSRLPKPYMDEEFHIGQTRLYCQGIYDQWDPLITTPPALYILAAFLGFCGRERFFNSMLVPICYFGFCRLRRKYLYESNAKIQQQKWKEKQFQTVHLPVLSTILLPVLFDTSFLFYTDLLSLTAVVWALSSVCPFHSFLAFALAILTRQTNILWAAFYCFPFVLEEFTKFWNGQSSFSRSFFQLIRRTFLHIILAICFFLFIFWNNGSIVLGDKSAHHPVFHSPQLLYFFLFTGASSFPLFIANFAQNYNKIFNRPYIFLFLAFSIFAFLSVHFCTMAHPYLLADNRHFTFYIWQRIFQRHWMIKYLLVPIYAIIALFMLEMTTLISKFTKFTFLFSTAFCLIPAKLLEFRYFIIPFTIWRLSLEHNTQKWALIMEIGFHLTVNILSLYLFLERPFKWANEPEEWQRFMW